MKTKSTKDFYQNSELVNSVMVSKKQPKDSVIEYIWDNDSKDGCNGPRAVLIALTVGDDVVIGFSAHAKEKDPKYDKYLSWAIAESRAKRYFGADNIDRSKLPGSMFRVTKADDCKTKVKVDLLKRFINKCLTRRCFQGKNFPKWVDKYLSN